MIHKRFLVGMILILAVTTSLFGLGTGETRLTAAAGQWSAWLYNYDTGQMIRVFSDGSPPQQMQFPLPPNVAMYPSSLAFSPDGARFAACLADDTGITAVRVYDTYAQSYTAAYIPSGPIVDCSFGRYSFSEDGSQLAVGIMNHWHDQVDTRPDWEVIVLDTITSQIVHRLTASDPAITWLGRDYSRMMPLIRAFQMGTAVYPGVIAVAPVPWATEGPPEVDSLVWQLSDGSVSIVGPYGKTALDLLPATGEAIWVDEDAGFPKGILEGPGYPFNVVMYSNKAGDRYPIFSDGSVLFNAEFIDNGQKVAALTYTSPNLEQWMYVDRNGGSGKLLVDAGVYRVWGTVDGYVFMKGSGQSGVQEMFEHRFAGAATPEERPIWSGMPGEYWDIIWVEPLDGDAGLAPFTALKTPAPMPTPGQPSGMLVIGGRAQVHTTAGDMLRVRTGPGMSFQVAFQLADGALVTLLEGPFSADGHTWWRIQTDAGQSGWAVEGVMDQGTYLQTLVPVQ
ncbi:MAG: SH3 domain-containing protein [Anaerolineae bacterium]|nr:SH3 domain-containing protein [Anaerolineae bacterium]